MTEDRDIRARLEIERGGETDAFRETAEDLEALPGAAEQAQDGLDQLVAAFEKLAQAEGPEQQQQALKDLADTYVEVGRAAAEGFKEGSAEAELLGLIIDTIEEKAAALGDGLESALARADDAWGRLEDSVDSGGEGIEQRLVALQVAIREYESTLKEAEATGQEVTDSHRQALDRLNDAYDQGAQRAGKYRAAQQDVRRDLDKTTEAAGGQARALTSIDDILEASGSKWATYALKAGAVVGTFEAFYGIGTKIRDVLADLSGGESDRFIQKWTGLDAIAAKLTGTLDEGAGAAERLKNNLKILAAEGIDATGMSAVEVDQAVQELGKAMADQRQEAAKSAEAAKEQAQAHEEWAASLGLSAKALDEESAALVTNIEKFAAANEGILDAGDLRTLFGEQIQGLLDDFARLGQEPPAALQKLADSWGVVTSAVEAAAGKHQAAVEKIRSDILGAAADTAREVEALVSALPEALAGIDFNTLNTAGLEKARQIVGDLLSAMRQSGTEIPASIAAIATSLGQFVSATEAAEGVSVSYAAGVDEMEGATVRLVKSVDEAGNVTHKLVQIAEAAEPGIAGFTEVVTKSDKAMADLTDTYGKGGSKLRELGAAAQEAGAATEKGGEAARGAAEGAKDLASATGDQADETQRAADASNALARDAEAVAAAAVEQSRAVRDAAEDLEGMAGAAERLAEAQRHTDLGEWLGDAAAVSSDLEALEQRLSGVLAAMEAVGAGAPAALAPARSELAGMKADADAAAASIRAALTAGSVAAPEAA